MKEQELIETAQAWLEATYDAYPKGIEGFDKRDFSPVPTIILEDELDAELFKNVVADHDYIPKTKRTSSGQILIAATLIGPGDTSKVIYTFDDTPETSLDSPRRHEDIPEDGRLVLVVDYLERKYE